MTSGFAGMVPLYGVLHKSPHAELSFILPPQGSVNDGLVKDLTPVSMVHLGNASKFLSITTLDTLYLFVLSFVISYSLRCVLLAMCSKIVAFW